MHQVRCQILAKVKTVMEMQYYTNILNHQINILHQFLAKNQDFSIYSHNIHQRYQLFLEIIMEMVPPSLKKQIITNPLKDSESNKFHKDQDNITCQLFVKRLLISARGKLQIILQLFNGSDMDTLIKYGKLSMYDFINQNHQKYRILLIKFQTIINQSQFFKGKSYLRIAKLALKSLKSDEIHNYLFQKIFSSQYLRINRDIPLVIIKILNIFQARQTSSHLMIPFQYFEMINQMTQQNIQAKQHEVYFSKADYLNLAQKYQRSNYKNYTQQQLLLVAKAYFIEEQYQKCLNVIKNIHPQHSSKILYQRQSLQFRSVFLKDRNKAPTPQFLIQLHQILMVFIKSIESVPGPKIQPHHQATINVYKQFVQILQKNLASQIILNNDLFQSQKRLEANSARYEGFPIYLVSNQWVQNFNNVNQLKNYYLCPLNNFNIVNDIFEIYPFEAKTNLHKNIYVFPVENYIAVTKRYWNYLNSIVNQGKQFAPIKRIGKGEIEIRLSSAEKSSIKTETKKKINKFHELIPIAIKFQQKIIVLQLNHNKPLQRQLYRIIQINFGPGQLRVNSNNLSELFDIEAPSQTYLSGFNKIIHFNKIKLPLNITFEQIQPLMKFQFNPIPQENLKNPQNGLKGLENIGNSCYLNSCLQCLSFTKELSSILATNNTFQLINLEMKDSIAVVALADVFKSLWTKDSKKYIFPRKFKRAFGQKNPQFSARTQEDAHEFLLCLLNSLHEDLKAVSRLLKANKKLSMTTDQKKVSQYFQRNQLQLNKSKIMDLFRGTIHNTMNCDSCSTQSHSYDTFLALTLPIPQKQQTFIDIYFCGFETKQTKRYRIHLDTIKTIDELFKQVKSTFLKPKIQYLHIFGQVNKETLIFQQLGVIEQKLEMFQQLTLQILLQKTQKVSFIIYQTKKKESNQVLTLLQYRLQKDGLIIGFPRIIAIDQRKIQDRMYYIDLKRDIAQYDKQNFIRSLDIQKLSINNLKTNIKSSRQKSNIFQVIIQVIFHSEEKLFKGCADLFEEFGDPNTKCDIYDCFNLMKKPEILENSWTCGHCLQNKKVQKAQEILSANDILVIHLKRFKADYRKIKTIVEYPLKNLDITKFVEKKDSTYKYDLYAVCLHTGTAEYGHYRAYCKHFISGDWFQFDDGLVHKIQEKAVVTENAYMLFYRRAAAAV